MTEQQQRLDKLKGILDTLKRGKNVQNRQLQRWLTEAEYNQIESDWHTQMQMREQLIDKPNEITRYEEKLKAAIFNYNRAEGYSARGNSKTARSFYVKSERLCEEGIELLQEIVGADASMQLWFDRALDFSAGSLIGGSVAAMPRVITSRSLDACGGGLLVAIRSKNQVKIDVVEAAIEGIENPPKQHSAENFSALKAAMSRLKFD
jgi:hypothetical protein